MKVCDLRCRGPEDSRRRHQGSAAVTAPAGTVRRRSPVCLASRSPSWPKPKWSRLSDRHSPASLSNLLRARDAHTTTETLRWRCEEYRSSAATFDLIPEFSMRPGCHPAAPSDAQSTHSRNPVTKATLLYWSVGQDLPRSTSLWRRTTIHASSGSYLIISDLQPARERALR